MSILIQFHKKTNTQLFMNIKHCQSSFSFIKIMQFSQICSKLRVDYVRSVCWVRCYALLSHQSQPELQGKWEEQLPRTSVGRLLIDCQPTFTLQSTDKRSTVACMTVSLLPTNRCNLLWNVRRNTSPQTVGRELVMCAGNTLVMRQLKVCCALHDSVV